MAAEFSAELKAVGMYYTHSEKTYWIWLIVGFKCCSTEFLDLNRAYMTVRCQAA